MLYLGQSLSRRMGIVPTGRRELHCRIQVLFGALEAKHLLLNLADHIKHAFWAAAEQSKVSIYRISTKYALVDFNSFKCTYPCSGQFISEKAAASVLKLPIDELFLPSEPLDISAWRQVIDQLFCISGIPVFRTSRILR
jgi:hypothetical protein